MALIIPSAICNQEIILERTIKPEGFVRENRMIFYSLRSLLHIATAGGLLPDAHGGQRHLLPIPPPSLSSFAFADLLHAGLQLLALEGNDEYRRL
jgi:hypothetical protein